MVSVAAAQRLLTGALPPRRMERVPLECALGRVLAGDVVAATYHPAFDRSAVDGYAVHALETSGAAEDCPVTLSVAGFLPAGHRVPVTLAPGTAVAVATGAPLPMGADAVIKDEDAGGVAGEGALARILVRRPVTPGDHVNRVGADAVAGTCLLAQGRPLKPADIGLLAMEGWVKVPVWARPQATVLATGDELVAVADRPGFGQVRVTTAYAVAAALRECGVEAAIAGPAPDDPQILADWLASREGHELLLTTGGVSVGRRDCLREAVRLLGARELFRWVAMSPGRNVLAAVFQGRLLIGLSGNPGAAVVSFDVIVRPVLGGLTGPGGDLAAVTGVLEGSVRDHARYTRYVRSETTFGEGGFQVAPLDSRHVNITGSLARANSLAVVPPGAGTLAVGTEVTVLLFPGWHLSCGNAADPV